MRLLLGVWAAGLVWTVVYTSIQVRRWKKLNELSSKSKTRVAR